MNYAKRDVTREIILSIITDWAIAQYYCGSARKRPKGDDAPWSGAAPRLNVIKLKASLHPRSATRFLRLQRSNVINGISYKLLRALFPLITVVVAGIRSGTPTLPRYVLQQLCDLIFTSSSKPWWFTNIRITVNETGSDRSVKLAPQNANLSTDNCFCK